MAATKTSRLVCLLVLLPAIAFGTSATVSSIADLPEGQRKLFNFLSAGVTRVIWDQIDSAKDLKITKVCKDSLAVTNSNIKSGSEWAFRILDSSSKSSAGLLDGTLTSFGDYDECLAVESNNTPLRFYGKHCMVELVPNENFESLGNITQEIVISLPAFGMANLQWGICMPSLCRQSDIQALLNQSLAGQPFRASGKISCDTMATNSWTHVLSNLTAAQKYAMFFLFLVMSAVSAGTTLNIVDVAFQLVTRESLKTYLPFPDAFEFILNFSFFRSYMSLVTVEKNDQQIGATEMIKMVIITIGITNQCAFLFEGSLGMNVTYRMFDLKSLMSSILAQPFSSQELYGLLFFVSGYITFRSTNGLSIVTMAKAVARKYLRFGPVLGCLIGFEFIWPLVASGPFYSQASKEIVSKCTNNWWAHVLMLGNTVPYDQACIPHTIAISQQFQLFLIGLILTFVLSKAPFFGLTLSSTLIAFATSVLYQKASFLESPVMLDHDLSYSKSMSYLENIQRPIYGHMINYVTGILAAFYMKGEIDSRLSIFDHMCSFISGIVVLFLPAVHNVYHLIEPDQYATFVMSAKVAGCLSSYILVKNIEKLIASLKVDYVEEEKEPESEDANERVENSFKSLIGEGRVVSLSKALIKVSFSMFLMSFFYIRLDFYTTRLLFSISQYNVFKRLIYSISYSFALGLYFHLVFLSPFNNIRNTFFPTKK